MRDGGKIQTWLGVTVDFQSEFTNTLLTERRNNWVYRHALPKRRIHFQVIRFHQIMFTQLMWTKVKVLLYFLEWNLRFWILCPFPENFLLDNFKPNLILQICSLKWPKIFVIDIWHPFDSSSITIILLSPFNPKILLFFKLFMFSFNLKNTVMMTTNPLRFLTATKKNWNRAQILQHYNPCISARIRVLPLLILSFFLVDFSTKVTSCIPDFLVRS